LIVVSLILFISWNFLKFAEIPFSLASKSISYMELSKTAITATNSLAGQSVTYIKIFFKFYDFFRILKKFLK